MYIRPNDDIQWGMKLRQFFRYQLRYDARANEESLMKQYQSGIISDLDCEILKFLYENRIALQSQINDAFPSAGPEIVSDELWKLLKYHFINEFMLGDGDPEIRFQDDALGYYTIDYVGVSLLSHLESDQDIENWNPGMVMMPVQKILKCVVLTEFHNVAAPLLKDSLVSYNAYRMFSGDPLRIIPKAELILKGNDGNKLSADVPNKAVLVEVADEDDLFYGDAAKLHEKLLRYAQFYEKRHWTKYYMPDPEIEAELDAAKADEVSTEISKDEVMENPRGLKLKKEDVTSAAEQEAFDKNLPCGPVLLMICENAEVALRVSEQMNDLHIPNYRMTTISLLKNEPETCMMRFSREKQKLVRFHSPYFNSRA